VVLREQRDRLRQLIQLAAVHRLRAALLELCEVDAEAQMAEADEADDAQKAQLGFFADGVDTAAVRVFVALGGEA
jgi:hypothetical protein